MDILCIPCGRDHECESGCAVLSSPGLTTVLLGGDSFQGQSLSKEVHVFIARPCLSHQAQNTNTLGGAFCSCCQCLGAVIAPSFGSVLLSAPLVMAGSARLASGDRQALCLSAGPGRKAAARPAEWQGFLCTLLIKPLGRCSPA